MRGYSVSVPADCCAAADERDHATALCTLERVADAAIRPSSELTFEETPSVNKSLNR
jgi:hypothetical protein